MLTIISFPKQKPPFILFNIPFCMQQIVLSAKFNNRYLWGGNYLTKPTSIPPERVFLRFSVYHINLSILVATKNKTCKGSKTYKIIKLGELLLSPCSLIMNEEVNDKDPHSSFPPQLADVSGRSAI